uniref:C2H2-type domain-containing protein n=1 Tax=viral metagenome TaxID=1070528 RepID=A0A6C0BR20_9ZZZZ
MLKYKIVCTECPDFSTNNDKDYQRHCFTKKHQNNCFGTWPEQKIFECEKCEFICYKKSNYEKHLTTNKHKLRCDNESSSERKTFNCLCGKTYKHQSSLCNHKKNCSIKEEKKEEKEEKDILIERRIENLLKNQEDILQMLYEIKLKLNSN